ncbi:MAG TPA: ABC transporter ATP-binding protein [Bryobacteraceae bacterium]|jgi:subfamily B ATP-binding cassette protein MsbA
MSPQSKPPDKPAKKKTSEQLRLVWPDIMELVRPRRGTLLIGLGLMAISRVCGLVLPFSTKALIDDVLGKGKHQLLVPIVLTVLAATFIQAVTAFSLTQVLSKAAQRLIAEMRQKVQVHISHLPVQYYDSTKSGVLVSRIMNDVEGIRNLIGTGLVEFVGGVFTAILSIIILFRISAVMTGVVVFFLLAFTLTLQKAFGSIRPIFRERGMITAEVTGRLTESLGGVRVVKGYHAETREQQVFSKGVTRLLDNVLKSLTAISVMSLSATVLLGVVGAGVMFFGARQIESGTLTLGGFVSFTTFLAFLIAPVFQVVGIGTQLTEAIAGLERTREIIHEMREDRDPKRTVIMPHVEGHVEFDHVTFAYEKGKEVLINVSLDAQPGSVTALVGPSGSGKSTMIGLICAFHNPEQGAVKVDGHDLSTVRLNSYRTQLGVVLQDTFLFDGSIRDNVGFSKPGATDEEILNACRIARVDEFAEKFEKQYETIVGERGVKLSGGQRQRVSIARAILADPRILILDEATSSLDSESEALIQEGLKYLMRGRTTFVIAHRLSTIRRADQILFVEKGEIIERGTHETLYNNRGRYRDLYDKQHGLEANLFLAEGEGDSVPESAGGGSRGGAGGGDVATAIRLVRG